MTCLTSKQQIMRYLVQPPCTNTNTNSNNKSSINDGIKNNIPIKTKSQCQDKDTNKTTATPPQKNSSINQSVTEQLNSSATVYTVAINEIVKSYLSSYGEYNNYQTVNLAFAQKLIKITKISFSQMVVSLIYLNRFYNSCVQLKLHIPGHKEATIPTVCHVVLICVILAERYITDTPHKISWWARVCAGSTKPREICQWQINFLETIGYKLYVNPEKDYEIFKYQVKRLAYRLCNNPVKIPPSFRHSINVCPKDKFAHSTTSPSNMGRSRSTTTTLPSIPNIIPRRHMTVQHHGFVSQETATTTTSTSSSASSSTHHSIQNLPIMVTNTYGNINNYRQRSIPRPTNINVNVLNTPLPSVHSFSNTTTTTNTTTTQTYLALPINNITQTQLTTSPVESNLEEVYSSPRRLYSSMDEESTLSYPNGHNPRMGQNLNLVNPILLTQSPSSMVMTASPSSFNITTPSITTTTTTTTTLPSIIPDINLLSRYPSTTSTSTSTSLNHHQTLRITRSPSPMMGTNEILLTRSPVSITTNGITRSPISIVINPSPIQTEEDGGVKEGNTPSRKRKTMETSTGCPSDHTINLSSEQEIKRQRMNSIGSLYQSTYGQNNSSPSINTTINPTTSSTQSSLNPINSNNKNKTRQYLCPHYRYEAKAMKTKVQSEITSYQPITPNYNSMEENSSGSEEEEDMKDFSKNPKSSFLKEEEDKKINTPTRLSKSSSSFPLNPTTNSNSNPSVSNLSSSSGNASTPNFNNCSRNSQNNNNGNSHFFLSRQSSSNTNSHSNNNNSNNNNNNNNGYTITITTDLPVLTLNNNNNGIPVSPPSTPQ